MAKKETLIVAANLHSFVSSTEEAEQQTKNKSQKKYAADSFAFAVKTFAEYIYSIAQEACTKREEQQISFIRGDNHHDIFIDNFGYIQMSHYNLLKDYAAPTGIMFKPGTTEMTLNKTEDGFPKGSFRLISYEANPANINDLRTSLSTLGKLGSILESRGDVGKEGTSAKLAEILIKMNPTDKIQKGSELAKFLKSNLLLSQQKLTTNSY